MSESVELVEVERIRADVAPVVSRATALVIVTPDDYSAAANFTKEIKSAQKKVDAFFDPVIESAHKTWKATLAQKATFSDPLKQAEAAVKGKQIAWQAEQERIRQAEQRRLQAEADERARKEREKAEAAARLQREKEAAARAEQERQERLAAQAKNEVERQRAAGAAEAARKVAEAAAAKADAKAEAAAAVVAPVVNVASVAPEVKGQSIRRTWKAKLVSLSALAGLSAGDVRLSFLAFDESAANRFAAATKGAVAVPGVEFGEVTTLASASK
jgi:colicin import membrane protein